LELVVNYKFFIFFLILCDLNIQSALNILEILILNLGPIFLTAVLFRFTEITLFPV
jgi:type IV secretory pathway VirB6-like protein